jgi:hypothetical protein
VYKFWLSNSSIALLFAFWTVSGFTQPIDEVVATKAQDQVRVCEGHAYRTYLLPIAGNPPRAVLDFPNGRVVVVEPSLRPQVDLGNLLVAKFDYRIIFEASGQRYQITSLAISPDDRDELAYRRLDSIGVSCISGNDVLVYLSFAVNGSARDFFYVGIDVNGHGEPILLGRSVYGVLSLDRKDLYSFSIWDSSGATVGNGMGAKHGYQVSKYRWKSGEQSIELVNMYNANAAYPAQILGRDGKGIRVGDPKAK